jgi:hypothetical protein
LPSALAVVDRSRPQGSLPTRLPSRNFLLDTAADEAAMIVRRFMLASAPK